jgi:thioredoxin-related protein|tara:strand:- start:401 stop:1060 length:660 start_codon:yes stop_codon:yes gene_type:complete
MTINYLNISNLKLVTGALVQALVKVFAKALTRTALIITSMLFISSIAFAEPSFTDKTMQQNFIDIKQQLPLYSKIYDDTRDPFKDAKAALTLAKETNRNVLIEIGGNWCSWCHVMDVFLEANPEVYKTLHSRFVMLKVNVSDSNENAEFMKSLPPVMGYPHMYVSTGAGKMLLSKDTGELHENGANSVNKWLTFIDQWEVKAIPDLAVIPDVSDRESRF